MRLSISAAIAALLFAAPAMAATYSGIFASGEGTGQIDLTSYPDGTDFTFVFTTSAPVTSGVAAYVYEAGFDQYFDVTGMNYGGDNEPVEQDHMFASSHFSTKLTTPNDYSLHYPDGDLSEHDFFQPQTVSVDVFVPDAFDGQTFTFTVTPAPEPATWALYTVGVGLIGGASRRRRFKAAQALRDPTGCELESPPSTAMAWPLT